MTNQLLRMVAREIAGAKYDELRMFGSERFARENPSEKHYVANNWIHCINLAKEQLGKMLMSESVSQHEKDAIMEELIDHAERSESANARDILQFTSQPREREDVKHIDNNPQLRSVGA
jgi:hypothetical protein